MTQLAIPHIEPTHTLETIISNFNETYNTNGEYLITIEGKHRYKIAASKDETLNVEVFISYCSPQHMYKLTAGGNVKLLSPRKLRIILINSIRT
jgi:hypothetical protein